VLCKHEVVGSIPTGSTSLLQYDLQSNKAVHELPNSPRLALRCRRVVWHREEGILPVVCAWRHVMCSEQCLRLQPQADILEAHDTMGANVCANESSQKQKLAYLSGVFFVTAPKVRCWFDPEK
jgi:hypothetical protein